MNNEHVKEKVARKRDHGRKTKASRTDHPMCTGENMELEEDSNVSLRTWRIFYRNEQKSSIRAFGGKVAAEKHDVATFSCASWKYGACKERIGKHHEKSTDVLTQAEGSDLQQSLANSSYGIDELDFLPDFTSLTKATDGPRCSFGDDPNCVPDECDCQLPVLELNPAWFRDARASINGDEHLSKSSRPCGHRPTEEVKHRCDKEIHQAMPQKCEAFFSNALPGVQAQDAGASSGGDNSNGDGNQDDIPSKHSTNVQLRQGLNRLCEDDDYINSRNAFGSKNNQDGSAEPRSASGKKNAHNDIGSTVTDLREVKKMLIDVKKRIDILLSR